MILAIAWHTFREVIRKKILHVLTGLGILIIAVSPFIPTTDEPDALVKMMLVVFFQVVVFLCIAGVIFLSATSLPHEIQSRTIYGILSKPISRLKIVTGKIVGFAILSAILLTILSLLNAASIKRIASGLPEASKNILKARNEFNASQFDVQGKIHHSREGIIWIEGGRDGVALWSFRDLYKEPYNKSPFKAEFNIKTECGREGIDTIPLAVGLEDVVSGRFKTEVLSVRADKPLVLRIPPDMVSKDMNITVFPILSADCIGVKQGDVRVYSLHKGFIFNYAKAVLITFLKCLLILIIAVMGSTYLSAPVSIISSLVVFLCGHALDFFRDFSILMQRYNLHEHALPVMPKKPCILFIYIDYIIRKPLEWFSVVMPDFKKFDVLKFLLKGINIPYETIGFSLGYTAIYAGICIFIASVIFRRREFF